MSKSDSLAAWLKGFYDLSLDSLPADKRKRLSRHVFLSNLWDTLIAEQRQIAVENIDAQRPTNLLDRLAAEDGFRKGFKRVSVPRRNKLNAARPRPSRRRVSDAEIRKLKRALEAEGFKHHKQCTEAYARYAIGATMPVVRRSFRERWNKLGFNKKGT